MVSQSARPSATVTDIGFSQYMSLPALAASTDAIECQLSPVAINTASMSARISNCNEAYNASKAAVVQMTAMMAAQWGRFNINVNCIIPRMLDTPANREAMPKADFSKWVTPDKIAEVMLFLASDASSAIQGAAIPVYGRG